MANNSVRRHAGLAKRFCKLESPRDLSEVLETDLHKIILLAHTVPYRTFEIPKANGGKRLIEDPEEVLKKVMKSLNEYLQCLCYFYKPPCAFGFIINHKKETYQRVPTGNSNIPFEQFSLYGLDNEHSAFAYRNQITYI